MSAQHTPGPWNYSAAAQCYEIGAPTRNLGSLVARTFYTRSIRVEEANARLIAAAPELLVALEAIRMAVVRYEDDDELDAAKDIVDGAIAKAKGA